MQAVLPARKIMTGHKVAGIGRKALARESARHHVVALDFGIKKNILRCLASVGCRVTVVPASTSASDIMALEPDGIFLSNGPGDPAATGAYAVAQISALVESGLPVFGICLGHQMLATGTGRANTENETGPSWCQSSGERC